MEPFVYSKLVKKTESNDFYNIQNRVGHVREIRLLHAAMGMTTESAEFLDALKKHLFYGKPLDIVNLAEECGDLLWYLAIALDELGVSFESVMERNIEKLKARYGDKFSEESAINRNLEEERKILEK